MATGEGSITLHVPQTRDGCEPFQTRILEAYRRRSETLEALIPQLYVKGLSVRDVSDAMTAVFQDAGVSPATASRIGQTIQEDFQTWQERSLSGYDVLYLFVDSMYVKGPRRRCAWLVLREPADGFFPAHPGWFKRSWVTIPISPSGHKGVADAPRPSTWSRSIHW